jgi:thiamine biosynthesis lipoprotein
MTLMARLGGVLVAMVLTGCAPPAPSKAEFFVFGTLVEASVTGLDRDSANTAFAGLQERFQYMHRNWHAWEAGQLVDINRAIAAGTVAQADDEIATLVRQSQVFEGASGGRFNPAIGRLVGMWGFHTSDYPIRAEIPAAAEIAGLLAARPSTSDLQLEAKGPGKWRVHSTNPAVQLDFGGIAKGYAVDLAIQALKLRNPEGAIVNAGGDLRAFGTNHGRPWRVAIENPLGGVIGVVEIDGDESVFTSGNYQRFGEDSSGYRYAHILDPRTGWPVDEVMSATVLHQSGVAADAAATALVVGGLDEWAEVARGMGLGALLMTDREGKVYLTRAMQARLEMQDGALERAVLLD